MSDETKHTPGPWRVLSYDDHRISIESDGGLLANVARLNCAPDDREAQLVMAADARLIAAAPDLLDALEELLATHSDYADRGTAAYKAARAAIAKAEGKP